MNILERQKDILSIISSLDISPTMFKNAVEKYNAIANYLRNHGLEADMYPQGSFAFGTVVRPTHRAPDAAYDLDFICQVKGCRDDHTPSDLRRHIEDILTSSDLYDGKLKACEECFTIEYADINGVGFSIDIVPATAENMATKQKLAALSRNPTLIDTAIVIPKHNGERNYSWLTNNPKGFRSWFDNINKPFMDNTRDTFRRRLYEQNQACFATVEEIPHELDRSPLQRVIQILKYHRNVYYTHIPAGSDLKPISAILNVTVAQIAENYRADCSTFELLDHVLSEMMVYAHQLELTSKQFEVQFGDRNVFSKREGKWVIMNPADPEDNLADKWNVDSRIPQMFFKWIKAANNDLVLAVQTADDRKFRSALENGFDSEYVSKILGDKYCKDVAAPKAIPTQRAPKPYGGL